MTRRAYPYAAEDLRRLRAHGDGWLGFFPHAIEEDA